RMSLNEKFGLLEEPLTIKYGGHSDQLSSTTALDRYRIVSLSKILSNTHNLSEFHKTEMLRMLHQKVEIYANGARKRGNDENALWAENIVKGS
ncbi:MAG TPA: glycosyltransferase family 2 protein, partial [bacterium]|nr:glycosyltransferase family 2 protein [bacterium]